MLQVCVNHLIGNKEGSGEKVVFIYSISILLYLLYVGFFFTVVLHGRNCYQSVFCISSHETFMYEFIYS